MFDTGRIAMQILDFKYWDTRHRTGDTPWDIGYAAPALIDYFDQVADRTLKVLIPGAGMAHEALYLQQQGWTNITICDISESALKKVEQWLMPEPEVRLVASDFFALEDSFDLIMEQTFFCALDPALRSRYVDKMADLLVEGGKLFGLLFNKQFDHPGPPFGGDKNEYVSLFNNKFYIKTMENCHNSIPQRAGSEVFFICVKNTI